MYIILYTRVLCVAEAKRICGDNSEGRRYVRFDRSPGQIPRRISDINLPHLSPTLTHSSLLSPTQTLPLSLSLPHFHPLKLSLSPSLSLHNTRTDTHKVVIAFVSFSKLNGRPSLRRQVFSEKYLIYNIISCGGGGLVSTGCRKLILWAVRACYTNIPRRKPNKTGGRSLIFFLVATKPRPVPGSLENSSAPKNLT